MHLEWAILWSGYNDNAILDHLLGNVRKSIFQTMLNQEPLPKMVDKFWEIAYQIAGDLAYGESNQFETKEDWRSCYFAKNPEHHHNKKKDWWKY